MVKPLPSSELPTSGRERTALEFLHHAQIKMIDEALAKVGDYGEVRLIVNRGKLRFLVTQTSHDALHWQPGSLRRSEG